MNLRLDTFVCFDLETTGLDFEFDRIIEIGAVKYEKGQKVGEFSQLINPGVPIPPDIETLTNISQVMVDQAPSIDNVIPQFESFLGDFPFVVGHNVRFDITFIRKHISTRYLNLVDSSFIDTAAMARLAWPGLKGYALASLAEFIGIAEPPSHRALRDAEVTATVYLNALAVIAKLPKNIQSHVAGLLFGLQSRGAILSSLEGLAKHLPPPLEFAYNYGDNVIGEAEIRPVGEYAEIDIDILNDVFENKIRNSLSDYEERPQQIDMAQQVAGAFNRSEVFLAEAPTGIGKSLAYLVPSLLWAKANGEGVIISTGTKNLQDQLFGKDIPLIRQALDFDFKAVLLKGRANYLCLFKYYELLNEATGSFGMEERQALLSLVIWAETTHTGDIAECTGFFPARWRYLWARASCEGNFCLGKTCHYYKRCFLFKVKNEALTAHIKIINHHLLFADFASGGDLLATSGHAILDEAHNLEKVAASYLGPEISYSQFLTLFNQIFTIKPVETGFLALAKMKALSLDRDEARNVSNDISKIQRKLMAARGDSNEFFEKLSSGVASARNGDENSREISYKDLTKFVPVQSCEKFAQTLKDLESALMNFSESLEELDSLKDKTELAVRVKALSQDIRDKRMAFEFLTQAADDEFVYWIEIPLKGEARLVSAPLEVGKILDLKFYDQLKTLIMCSATLSVAGDFSYFKNRLGLNLASNDRTFERALDSPFDLKRNVGFYEASFLPPPNAADFDRQVGDVVYELFSSIGAKGMVLFTAYKNIISVVDSVGERLLDKGFELFVQDGSQSPIKLLSRYRSSPKGIIFGTDSFWEGVDLPGEDLQLLVIVKLPFSVPDRPWTKANLDKIEASGGNPFRDFSLPEAVIKFRQGFGRLIRKKTDWGSIVVLDSRLTGKEYGRYFVRSVQPSLFQCRSVNELRIAVEQHFKKMAEV